jgi:hypothetical protein
MLLLLLLLLLMPMLVVVVVVVVVVGKIHLPGLSLGPGRLCQHCF